MTPSLAALTVADPPEAWAAVGFAVDPGGVVRLGTVRIRLAGAGAGRGVVAWSLRGGEPGSIDGLPTDATDDPPPEPATHPNGARRVDHVVVWTPDGDRTVAALEARGLPARRVRRVRGPGAPIRQTFFRLGEVVLEVVAPEEAGEGPAGFFGLAVTVDDLDAAAALLGDRLGPARDAVQPGRRIATLRREAGLSVPMALMSPEPPAEPGPRPRRGPAQAG